MNRRVKVPSVLFAVASAFWWREFPGFSRIFHKLEVKATNCRRFPLLHPRQTWWSDCNSTCRTNSCGKTSKSSYNGTVSAGRKKRGEKSEESASGESPVFSAPFGISFIMRTQSTFSRSSSLVLAIRDHSVPRGRSISIERSFLKSRASIYWVFSSVKIFHRTCLSRRQEAVHRQTFSERCRITTQRDILRFLRYKSIFFYFFLAIIINCIKNLCMNDSI